MDNPKQLNLVLEKPLKKAIGTWENPGGAQVRAA